MGRGKGHGARATRIPSRSDPSVHPEPALASRRRAASRVPRAACRVPRFWLLLALLLAPFAHAADYVRHELREGALVLTSTESTLTLRFRSAGAIEAHYEKPGIRQLPSFSIAEPDAAPAAVLATTLGETGGTLTYATPQLRARIEKSPLRVSYWRGDTLLVAEEAGGYAHETLRGFRFKLGKDEKLAGGGQRVLGMNRRGQRLPLYNRPHYGYTTHSEQMYYSLPAVFSDRKYLLLFDNSANGWLDIGKTEQDILEFQAVGGRTSYLVFAAPDYPGVLREYTAVTGRQPLPPRWAFGNYASRFGYHTEAEVRDVVRRFRELAIPLDALVIDLYWFGKEIQGHLGKLDWDREAFPTAEQMLADLAAQGVNTILVTEPFILTTSTRWKEAVAADVLAKDLAGRPKTFDFYFGNTGLIDVFKPSAREWFWGIYKGLIEQGVAGVWGDLGEPEVHPNDSVHVNGIAEEVHNAYGHEWARLVYEGHLEAWPQRRPFIMMRAGAAGSQRYGMIPWTGDVDRSWGGLAPQVELALQMGMLGLGYTHSDLGGFAGGKRFDRELYLRWLQYGVFQPLFRPHAQEHIPSEPVFHDRKTVELARQAIELRYRLLPYTYTLAWENATTGLPFARPLAFLVESDSKLFERSDAYLWGDALLVRPITQRRQRRVNLDLPRGVWFDFFDGTRFEGGRNHRLKTRPDAIPVFARAGAFVPMAPLVQSTREYSTAKLELHHWTDASVAQASGRMYEDDGASRTAIEDGRHELLRFTATRADGELAIAFERAGGDYAGRPAVREITLVLHGWAQAPASLEVDGQAQAFERNPKSGELRVRFEWAGERAALRLR